MAEEPLKMDQKPKARRPSGNFTKKKDKFGRKRSQSFTGGSGKFCAPYKCRKRPMLPTKFLLGGNICDPLNLNSLQDEEVNRTVNAVTPKSSPIPTPPQRRGHIEVIIPPNIHDPLNLIDCDNDVEYEQQLTSPYKKGSKRRKKKKRTSSATTEPSDADISSSNEAKTPDKPLDSAKIPEIISTPDQTKLISVTKDLSKELKLELSPQKDKKRKSIDKDCKKVRRMDGMDKIVSPVVPQPGAWVKRNVQRNVVINRGAKSRGQGEKAPMFKDKNKAYQYGNYNRYYGYRNPNHEVDPRLKCFVNYRHLFFGKDILDIGCNIGHITLTIARDFGAKSIVGLDIDKKLIGIARKNIRHYVNCYDSPRDETEAPDSEVQTDKFFPISMPILYGPVDIPGMANENKGKGFPHNVSFVQGNYVLEDDALLLADQTQFDVILCLSVTKWMHLNWGDGGLRQAFKRMYAQLRPGGKLILEPQSWASYKHKKTLTETIYKNYHSIEFFPEKFTQYLLSSEVGFAKAEIMGHPHHTSKGFQRPIQIFTKSDLSPSQSQRSYSCTPSHTITSLAGGNKPVYTSLNSPYYMNEDAKHQDEKSESNKENTEIKKIDKNVNKQIEVNAEKIQDKCKTTEMKMDESNKQKYDLEEKPMDGEIQTLHKTTEDTSNHSNKKNNELCTKDQDLVNRMGGEKVVDDKKGGNGRINNWGKRKMEPCEGNGKKRRMEVEQEPNKSENQEIERRMDGKKETSDKKMDNGIVHVLDKSEDKIIENFKVLERRMDRDQKNLDNQEKQIDDDTERRKAEAINEKGTENNINEINEKENSFIKNKNIQTRVDGEKNSDEKSIKNKSSVKETVRDENPENEKINNKLNPERRTVANLNDNIDNKRQIEEDTEISSKKRKIDNHTKGREESETESKTKNTKENQNSIDTVVSSSQNFDQNILDKT